MSDTAPAFTIIGLPNQADFQPGDAVRHMLEAHTVFVGGERHLLGRGRLDRRQLAQHVQDHRFHVDGHAQPPRLRVSRAMTTCWIWLVPS